MKAIWSSTKRFFWGPWFWRALALISIILNVYLYDAGKSKRELMFYCHPIKTTLVRGEQISPLEVYANNEKIIQDVTAAQTAIWNSGNKSIEESDILKQVMIYTEPKVPFIDAEIRKVSRDVINLSLDKKYMNEGYIPLSWRILEQNDGGTIQVIYKGGKDIKVLIKGIVKEQKQISIFQYRGKISTPEEQLISAIMLQRMETLFFLALCILTFAIMWYLNYFVRRIKAKEARISSKIKSLGEEEAKELFQRAGERYILEPFPKKRVMSVSLNIALFLLGISLFIAFIKSLLERNIVGPPFGF